GAGEGAFDGVGLGADADGAGEVVVGEGFDGREDARPAAVPIGGDGGSAGGAGREVVGELGVAVARGLLAVGGEEVGEAGEEVAGDVLHDDGNGVGGGREGAAEGGIVEL